MGKLKEALTREYDCDERVKRAVIWGTVALTTYLPKPFMTPDDVHKARESNVTPEEPKDDLILHPYSELRKAA